MSASTRTALVLASLAALAPFAIDTYLPAFPAIEADLGATTWELQQSLALYLLPYALMTLFHGAISDSIGRLAAIRWGLLVFSFASLGCALAPNVETLWFFRILQGFFTKIVCDLPEFFWLGNHCFQCFFPAPIVHMTHFKPSKAKFNSRTFTVGSPRKPSWRPSVY